MKSSPEFQNLEKPIRELIAPYLSQKPVPLGAMAKALGVTVKVAPMERGISGQISRVATGAYEIKINKFESRSRQRFTLAHEIAHFLLHRDIIDSENCIQDNILLRSGLPQEIEYQANRLASDLVMPTDMVAKDFDLLSPNSDVTSEIVSKLAETWSVSSAAMEIKLNNF